MGRKFYSGRSKKQRESRGREGRKKKQMETQEPKARKEIKEAKNDMRIGSEESYEGRKYVVGRKGSRGKKRKSTNKKKRISGNKNGNLRS